MEKTYRTLKENSVNCEDNPAFVPFPETTLLEDALEDEQGVVKCNTQYNFIGNAG